MDAELARMGLAATFVYAMPPHWTFSVGNMRRNPRIEFALSLSHIKAVMHALADGAERPLFLEDDVVFTAGPERLTEVAAELPPEWDILYLGGHPREPVRPVSHSLVKVGTFSFAEAYALNGKALRPFLDFWLDRIGQPHAMYDFILGEFAAERNGYCAYPLLTQQAAVPSHVSGKVENKDGLLAKGWATN